jgi:hypothetical protein
MSGPSLTSGRVCNLQCNHAVVRVVKDHNYILLSHQIHPQPGRPVTIFMSLKNRVAQLYLQALGFFVLSNSSYITTDVQSASSSWCRTHCGAHNQILICVLFLRPVVI